ncbi:MAG: exo-alpha-sialidase [Victivallales bacterium]|nr:exo-alpha-sialidase [Victivallales bacterium]
MQESFHIITEPEEKYSLKYRFWQGCPTIARTRGGRLFAGWYTGGTHEPAPNHYNLLAQSDDDGRTWQEPVLIVASAPENHVRAIDIQLWTDPVGKLWLLWTCRDDNVPDIDPNHLSTWAIVCDNPDAAQLAWSKPRCLAPGFTRCQMTVLPDGRWLLPAYDWTCDRYSWSESSDQGQTFQRRHGGKKLGAFFDEGMFVSLRNGDIHLYLRSNTGNIVLSRSTDNGKTWSDGAPSGIRSPSSRHFIQRLPSGNLLLLCNNHNRERINMSAFLSEDDGATWLGPLVLDTRPYSSYPDAAVSPEGVITAVFDIERSKVGAIVQSRFTEEDIRKGRIVTPDCYCCRTLSVIPPHYSEEAYRKCQQEEEEFQHFCNQINGKE